MESVSLLLDYITDIMFHQICYTAENICWYPVSTFSNMERNLIF